jgi:serine/threonine protein kinase
MSQNDKMKKLSAKYGSLQYFKNIFPEYIRSKGLVQNTEKITRFATLKSNRTYTEKKLKLIPDYYDESIHFSNKIFNLNKTASGSFATVYLQYYNRNNKYKTRKSNIIFKEIKDADGSEYKALIFHYLLEYYYEINDPSKLKYLCILKEVGKIPETGKIYGIMDYCGKELVTIKDYPLIKSTPLKGLSFIVDVFKESLIALKLIHDVGYLHMDIKPQNYLFNYKNGKYEVKIIDFGMITKCYSSERGWYGTSLYLPNDWLYNYSKGLPTILDKHHDLFQLGCMFIDMIFYLLNNFTYKQNLAMCCPIKNNIYTQDQVIAYRTSYNENQHNADMKFISNLLGANGLRLNSTINDMIINIIFKMVHPIPSKRFKSIDEILPKVDELIDELLPPPPKKLLNANQPQNIKFRKVTPEKRHVAIQHVNSPMRYQIPQIPVPLYPYQIPSKPNIPKSPYVYQIQPPKKITPELKNRKQLYYNQMRLQLKKQQNEKLKKKHTPENLGVRAGKFQRYKDAYEKYL